MWWWNEWIAFHRLIRSWEIIANDAVGGFILIIWSRAISVVLFACFDDSEKMSGTDSRKCFRHNTASRRLFSTDLSPTQDLRSDVEVLRAARGAEAQENKRWISSRWWGQWTNGKIWVVGHQEYECWNQKDPQDWLVIYIHIYNYI